jgi:hypothetical protein
MPLLSFLRTGGERKVEDFSELNIIIMASNGSLFIAFYFLGLWAAYNNQQWFGLSATIFFVRTSQKRIFASIPQPFGFISLFNNTARFIYFL